MRKRTIPLATLAFAIGLAPAPAHAQRSRDLRLHIETSAFSFTSTSSDGGTDRTATRVGIFPSSLGFGLGTVVGDSLVLGGSFVLDFQSISTEQGDGDTRGNFMLRPYLELLLGHGEIRPFVGAGVGFGYSSADGNAATTAELAALGGAHFTLGPAASFDLTGRIFYQSVAADALDQSHIGLILLLGISGWT